MTDTRIDDVIDRALAEQRIVGTVVLISRGGELAYARAAGLADRERNQAMALDTVFRLASVTKPIVAAAALAMVERGQLALDAPVSRWLPDFRPRAPGGADAEIAIAQLLTHTSGLSYGFLQPDDGPYLKAGVSDGLDLPDRSMADNLSRLAALELFFPPGAAWNYSVSLDVLGAAMEQAAGKLLPQLVEELVLAPLGMGASGFYVEDAGLLATPYIDGQPPRPMQEPDVSPFFELSGIRYSPARATRPASFPSGGAGMVGTASDVLKLLEAVRTGGGPILSAGSAAAMLSNQIGDLVVTTHGPGWGFGYAGAVLKDPVAAGSPLRQGTVLWGGVYGHSWQIVPDRETTIVALTNTAIEGMSGMFPTELGAAVAQALG
ncbi:serine hydrolase domain-containing protein [Phenylobacterium sp.]|uniref:serine hydrolase domain-containing protein n=1 Tax=Phenylobacterium sp. TaxID=1871053 RepID=UPI002898B447|nr:serine hydrolase domain-containing protein [Phenylobacterium sp.]